MKKNILLILIFIFFNIFSVSGKTILDNNINDTGAIFSSNNIGYVDNEYITNISDVFTDVIITSNNIQYPHIKNFIFIDSKDNTLIISVENTIIKGLIFNDINKKYTSSYNNNIIITPTNYTFTDLGFSYSDKFIFSGSTLYIYPSITSNTNFIGKANKNLYFGSFRLTPDTSYYTITSIGLKYFDRGIQNEQADIDDKYNEMNFIFKFIFLILNGLLNILRGVSVLVAGILTIFGGNFEGISNSDVINFESILIEPLYVIDQFLGAMWILLRFIYVNGIIWFMLITSLIIFIYSWIQCKMEKNALIKTFIKFGSNAVVFYTIVLIKPLIWMYENLFLGVIRLLRG